MKNNIICWIGRTDLRAPEEEDAIGIGPIAQAVATYTYDAIDLITDYPNRETKHYISWLEGRTPTPIKVHRFKLTSPTDFGEIYQAATQVISEVFERSKERPTLTYHLSPGTPAMAAVWILLGKTLFPARFIESSREHGAQVAHVPFDISAEFVPRLLQGSDERLEKLSVGLPIENPAFADIVHQSAPMQRLIARAHKVSLRSVPVLIEGESGTGKELLARAIHGAGPRKDKPFLAVNCGAIPADLIESELFGYEKGAFTGATTTKKGYFESADGGSLFLDEVGELPALAQVKLLRVLQEREIIRLGAVLPIKVNVRIIAATNRTLANEVTAGNFREDLFYRLAVAILQIPALRERPGDLGLLIDYIMDKINAEHLDTPGYEQKKISVNARNLLLKHSWPGNIRELINTLQRAAMWASADTIRLDDVREAILPPLQVKETDLLARPIGKGFNLQDILTLVVRTYLQRAMDEANGNKRQATELLGLPSYQTLTNWLRKYDVED
jgi:DNA-binding NtrC family response regulator